MIWIKCNFEFIYFQYIILKMPQKHLKTTSFHRRGSLNAPLDSVFEYTNAKSFSLSFNLDFLCLAYSVLNPPSHPLPSPNHLSGCQVVTAVAWSWHFWKELFDKPRSGAAQGKQSETQTQLEMGLCLFVCLGCCSVSLTC